MGALRGLGRRLRGLLRRDATERELDEEIRFHLELETEHNIRLGMTPEDARRRALVAFGGIEPTKEAHRDGRGGRWLEEFAADARFALRTLRRNPVLTLAATLTLALGIGANTAIFSVVNAVILRPLPFPHAERLVMLSENNAEKGWRRNVVAPANYLDWKERVRAFEDAAAYTPGGGSTLTGLGNPRRVFTRSVTGNFFAVLGVQPALGRTLRDAETWTSGTPVVVISHRLWMDAFSGDAAVIGRSVPFDGVRTTIVGVMPASFRFHSDSVDAWRGMEWDPANRAQVFFRRAHWVNVIARLQPGITPQTADAEFQAVVHRLQVEYPETNRVMGAELTPLHDFLIGDVKPALLVLQGAVGLLLLIACANVGNLLLVQAAGREREASLRLTLGASRARLVRQALTESLVLSAIGGAAGFALGWWGTRILAALVPGGMLPVREVPMDLRVLLGIAAVTTATGLLFGIAPALWSARRVPAEVLKEGGKGATGHRIRRWGDALVVAEVAIALILTAGAGLLLRSFWRLERVDPGLDVHGVLAAGLDLPNAYDNNDKQRAFFDALRARVRAIPGVTAVASSIVAPVGGVGYTSDFHVAGRPPEDYGSEVARDYVSPDYFRTLRIPLRRGRSFTDADRTGAEPVVIINEAMANKHFRGQDPVGQRITFDKHPDSTSVWRTIVGVVADIHQRGLARDPQITAYESAGQRINSYSTLLVRTGGDAEALLPAVRHALAEQDPTIALAQSGSLERALVRSLARQRFIVTLLLVFAVTGLVLAVVGIYGVMAQTARSRTREMGIRMALGARTGAVQWMVVRHGLALTVAGLAIGLPVALAAARTIRALLYQVAPTDPLTFVSVPAVLALTALAASWFPALRASRTNPAVTLREE
jgi:putative ABC transport system permease protein